MTQEEVLLAKISCLENELRAMRETLRDKFAGQAIGAILDQKDAHDARERDNAAWMAYQLADNMLEARK